MSDIATSRDGSVLTIAFNRPAKKNAITAAMYQAMADALKAADADAGVRVWCCSKAARTSIPPATTSRTFSQDPRPGSDSPGVPVPRQPVARRSR